MEQREYTQELRTLGQLSRGARGIIHAVRGTSNEGKRLLVMGLRPGTAFTLLLGPDRRGVVLDSAGTRIALGREWLEQVQVRPLSSSGEG
ncbi:ferrous iron transport protein A [Acidithiobacillus sp. YTS05]|nr:ferrous iron transport protein A [Acidithiobacillus sp. YTS05]